MVAHSVGRLGQALRERSSLPTPRRSVREADAGGDDFLSGASGTVGGLRRCPPRGAPTCSALDASIVMGRRARLARAARARPPRDGCWCSASSARSGARWRSAMRAELLRSRHEVELQLTAPGELGKFENLNRAARPSISRRAMTGC